MTDRAVRNLDHLRRSASTARVLNLLRVWELHGDSRDDGGDLGWFPADAFGPAFGQQVSGLRGGEGGEVCGAHRHLATPPPGSRAP